MKTLRHEAERHLEFWTRKGSEVPGYVYLIQGDPETPIKIGYAKDPRRQYAPQRQPRSPQGTARLTSRPPLPPRRTRARAHGRSAQRRYVAERPVP